MALPRADSNPLLKELPHLLVFLLLLLVLLVVLTKFGWVHCSQVPGNWCELYCNQIMHTRSRVALISGESGIGDPYALENMIRRVRTLTNVEPYQAKYLSSGSLKGFDLVILERMDTVSFTQALAVKNYLTSGGSVLWIGDAMTKFYVDDYEIAKARAMDEEMQYDAQVHNQTLSDPHYYENALMNASTTRGFYLLSDVLMADYVSTNSSSTPVNLRIVNHESMMTRGLFPEFETLAKDYVVVATNPEATDIVAFIKVGGKEHPAIYETRYSGKVVFVAFPLEAANSSTLVMNVLDYLVTC